MTLAALVLATLLTGCQSGEPLFSGQAVSRHNVDLTLIVHPTTETIRRAARYRSVPQWRTLCGFYLEGLQEAHVLGPVSRYDDAGIYAIGHEVLHQILAPWHAGENVGVPCE